MSAQPEDLKLDNPYLESKALAALNKKVSGLPKTWFVKWNAVAELPQTDGAENVAQYWAPLEKLVERLDAAPPLLRLSHRGDSGAQVHLLRDLVHCYWTVETPEKREVLRALKLMNYSALLEQAVVQRIRRSVVRAKLQQGQPAKEQKIGARLVIATLDSGSRAEDAIHTVLGWIQNIDPTQRIIVFAREKPLTELITEFWFQRQDLFEDVSAIFDAQSANPEAAKAISTGFLARLRRTVGRLARRPQPVEVAMPRAESLGVPDLADDWAHLVARLAAPNLSVVAQLVIEWARVGGRVEKMVESAAKKAADANKGAKRRDLLDLDINNEEERYRLEGRLRFLTLFKVLHPKAFSWVVGDAEGADQLYRLHLILVGETASDGLVAGALLPEWATLLADSSFRELFQSCFTLMRNECALVSRFESRLQLQNHLRWLNDDSSSEDETDDKPTLDTVSKLHRDWMKEVAKGVAELPSASKLLAAIEALRNASTSAADSLQAAQILLSVGELSDDFARHKETFDSLITDAIRASRGGIRFDANLTQARGLALHDRSDAALRLLRIQKRIAGDELMRLAVDIEAAFACERERDFFQARVLYQKVIKAAEDLGADELVARAASGCLRSDVLMTHPDSPDATRALRAQIMLQIQSARAIELAPLSARTKPKLFLSYRSDSRLVTRSLNAALSHKTPKHLLDTFYDKESIKSGMDFSPAIHSGLLDSDGVVLLLSDDFFNSPWCVHELHFALGQHDVRGIAIFWTWCERVAAGAPVPAMTPEEAVREWVKKKFDQTEVALRGYAMSHLEDRIKRIFAYGCRLTENIVPYPPADPLPHAGADEEPVDMQLGERLMKPIRLRAKRIYERARLPFPEGLEGV